MSQARELFKRLAPKGVIGTTALVLAFSVGAALSGVVLYSYYEYRLDTNEQRVDNYIAGFDDRYRTATQTIDDEEQNARAAIQEELAPLRQFQAEGGTLEKLADQLGPSVFFIETLDERGAPSVGTGFVVESNDNESLLVTSFSTVRASTRAPGPEITVRKGEDRIAGRLSNWVENQDLAVVTIPRGGLDRLEWVANDQEPVVGERTFVASGLGAGDISVTQGFVTDVTVQALQHDAAVGPAFRGAPLINSDGRVTGVASINFAPFGFESTSGVTFANPIRTSCDTLLRCPEGGEIGAGARP